MIPEDIAAAAETLLARCVERNLRLVTAESCTGGLLAGALTAIPGSSAVFERGFITYSNAAKTEMLDVPAQMIESHGAVSAEVACAMAAGALVRARGDIAAAVTGVAGPDGGTPEKPVGLVWIAIARAGGSPTAHRCGFAGDRSEVRRQTVERALALLTEAAQA